MVLLAFGLFSVPPHDHINRMGNVLFSVPPPVSRDHMNRNGIVNLNCWNIKIFFGFLGLLSALIFILGAFGLWCFCPLGFSLSHHMIILTEWGMCTPVSRDHMNRNGIVHLDLWSIKIFSGFAGLLFALIFILGVLYSYINSNRLV